MIWPASPNATSTGSAIASARRFEILICPSKAMFPQEPRSRCCHYTCFAFATEPRAQPTDAERYTIARKVHKLYALLPSAHKPTVNLEAAGGVGGTRGKLAFRSGQRSID